MCFALELGLLNLELVYLWVIVKDLLELLLGFCLLWRVSVLWGVWEFVVVLMMLLTSSFMSGKYWCTCLWQNSSQLPYGSLLISIIYNVSGAKFNDKYMWWSVKIFGPSSLRVVGFRCNLLNVLTACNWHMHFKQMKPLKWKQIIFSS